MTKRDDRVDDFAINVTQDTLETIPEEILAQCRKVEPPKQYRTWRKNGQGTFRSRFTFEILEPPELSGQTIEYFMRWEPNWKKSGPPVRSKLRRAAEIALGRSLKRGDLIARTLWEGRVFRCAAAMSGKAPHAVPVIRSLLVAETGPISESLASQIACVSGEGER